MKERRAREYYTVASLSLRTSHFLARWSGLRPWPFKGFLREFGIVKRLIEISEMNGRGEADEALHHWEDFLTEQIKEDFSSITDALSSWREEILNYFDTDHTTAFIEATNRSIRQIYRERMRMDFKALKAHAKFGIEERRRYREEGRLNPLDLFIRVPLEPLPNDFNS